MTSTAVTIAKKDFVDAVRSRFLWGTILVLLVVTIPPYVEMVDGTLIDSGNEAIEFIPNTFVNFVAPLAMIAGHRAVVGERETGSLKLLFGLPVTRGDLLVGKAISRSLLIASSLVISTGCLATIAVAIHGGLDVALLLAIAGYVSLYAIAWTGLTVGISAAASTRLQAIASVLGLFLFFGPFQIWHRFVLPVFAMVFDTDGTMAGIDPLRWSTWPTWYRYASRLNPMENFTHGTYYVVRLLDPTTSAAGHHAVNLFGFAVLLAWCLVPLLIGYWRFMRVDLA